MIAACPLCSVARAAALPSGVAPRAHSAANVSMSTLPPLAMTPILSARIGTRRVITAASTVAPAGSTIIFIRCAAKRIAVQISSSVTSKTPAASARTIGHGTMPGAVVRTPSAMVFGAPMTTRSPVCHERYQSLPASGSMP